MGLGRVRPVAGRNSEVRPSGVRRVLGWSLALAAFAATGMQTAAPAVAGAAEQPPRLVALNSGQPRPEDDPRIVAFDNYIREKVAEGSFVGIAVAIVDNGRLSLVRGYGRRSLNDGGKVDDQTVFRIASLSKGFAASLTGLMVKEHYVDWSTPVRQVLPNVSLGAARNNVTVGDLLSHRVGLPHNAFDDLLEAGLPPEQIVNRLATLPVSCAPGSCYGYQNVAFNLLAPVLEARTGQSYADLVQQRLFTPLAMHRASIGMEGLKRDENWARPHVRIGKAQWREVTVKEPYYGVPAAAGVNASARDMAKWLMAHLGMAPQTLPADVLETIHKPRVTTPKELYRGRARYEGLQSARYGYGWRVYDINGVEVVWHAGAVQGYVAQIAFVPERKSGIVLLTNGYSQDFPTLLPAYLETFIDGIKTRGLVLNGFPKKDKAVSTLASHTGAASEQPGPGGE